MALASKPFVRDPQLSATHAGGAGAFILLSANQTSCDLGHPDLACDVIPPGSSLTRAFLSGEMELLVVRGSKDSQGLLGCYWECQGGENLCGQGHCDVSLTAQFLLSF